MSIFNRCLFSLVLCSGLLALSAMAEKPALSAPPALQKLSLTAALVLTPEFCATVSKKGHEKFKVGKSACAELEPALRGIFTRLTQVDDPTKAGGAQVVLQPRFADVGATQKAFAFSNRELVVLVEWTARDQSGKAIWIDTVQGSASRHIGNMYTYKKNLKHIVKDSAHDMAEQSAAKMSSSLQLQQLSAAPVK